MLVSIITPVKNGAAYIGELLESVESQDYSEIEHLVVDAGSTDDTHTWLAHYSRVRWWVSPKRQYPSMNEGLAAARGDIVCFINADDRLCPGAVSTAVAYLRNHPKIDAVYGRVFRIIGSGQPYPVQSPFGRLPANWYAYIPFISHCSLYVRREKLIQSGLFFDEQFEYVADYDWILRLIKSGLRFDFIDQNLSEFRVHAEARSVSQQQAMLAETRRAVEKNGASWAGFRLARGVLGLRSAVIMMAGTLKHEGVQPGLELAARWIKKRLPFRK